MTFDPSEKRDDHGRWTVGGTASNNVVNSDNVEHGKELAAKATEVAVELGFDPKNISITDQDKTFELNGKTYDYAGAAYITGDRKGQIELYSNKVDDRSVNEVTAHEIGHQKFQSFIDDLQKERDVVLHAPGPPPNPNGETIWERHGGIDAIMSADGTLREPYAKMYPLYTAYEQIMKDAGGIEGMSKSDGITNYSREWWQSWKDGKANTPQAMHETIAEMTARDYVEGGGEEGIREQFKRAGYSLDSSSSAGKTTYSVRKWRGKNTLDEATLPPEIQKGLLKLRKGATNAAFGVTSKFSKPAPEWQRLYDAVNEHWKHT